MIHSIISRLLFRFRYGLWPRPLLATCYWRLLGMRIGAKTRLYDAYVTWPHQVSIGAEGRIEHGVYFHYDGIYQPGVAITIGEKCFIGHHVEFNISRKLTIGQRVLVAAGARFIDHNHGALRPDGTREPDQGQAIVVEDDVWIGANCVILSGVRLEAGAIIAAGAVVTKSVPAREIWAGVPARKIGPRL